MKKMILVLIAVVGLGFFGVGLWTLKAQKARIFKPRARVRTELNAGTTSLGTGGVLPVESLKGPLVQLQQVEKPCLSPGELDDAPDNVHKKDLERLELLQPGTLYTRVFHKKCLDYGRVVEDFDVFKVEAPQGATIHFKVSPLPNRKVQSLGIDNASLMRPPEYSVRELTEYGEDKQHIIFAKELAIEVNDKNTKIENGQGLFYVSVSALAGSDEGDPYGIEYWIVPSVSNEP